MELMISVFLFALVSTVTPGPNNIMVMTSGLNHGIIRTIPHYAGICIGVPTMIFAVALGLGTIFAFVPGLHQIIKIVGIAYLLYLAYRIAISQANTDHKAKNRPLTFWEAAFFQWVNPKAWIMTMGALATFSSLHSEPTWQAIYLSLIFMVTAFPSVGLWLISGATLRKVLKKPAYLQVFNLSMATLLVLSVVPMIFA